MTGRVEGDMAYGMGLSADDVMNTFLVNVPDVKLSFFR